MEGFKVDLGNLIDFVKILYYIIFIDNGVLFNYINKG